MMPLQAIRHHQGMLQAADGSLWNAAGCGNWFEIRV